MAAPQTPQQKRDQQEKQRVRETKRRRESRRLELGLTAAEYEGFLQDRRSKVSKTQSTHDRLIDQRAALWNQGLRIESYLPALQDQRQKMATDLQDLQDLIRDEEQALADMHSRFN